VRIAETDVGMLNTIGLANPGIAAFLRILPQLARVGVPVWVSVGGFAAEEYAELCAQLDGEDVVDTIELNVSCPNVAAPHESAWEIVRAARAATSKPVYAKLSPAVPDIAEVARAAAAAGADGLSLVNTIRGLALDERSLAPRLSTAAGGMSGPALRPVALAAVYACASAVDLPIVGMGGVGSGRDALELIAVGASAVALGTILFSDPGAPDRIRAELEAEALALGVDNPGDLRGIAHQEGGIGALRAVENGVGNAREKAAISTEKTALKPGRSSG
jgi:dihydroorotate dehydrogenase (NAD+) catalytic subunit